MAITIEQLEVLVKANTEQFNSEMQRINATLGMMGETTGGISSAIGGSLTSSIMVANIASQALMATLRKVGDAVWNVTKQVISGGSELARMRIATDTVARNMGVTKQAIDDLRNSLAESNTYGVVAENVIKTLAMSGLFKMAEQLQATDARTGEVVTGVNALVLSMKDLAAAAGLDSAEGIERLTKFIRRGELALADGIIEVGRITTSYKEYADSIGKTVEQLTGQEQAQARMNIVMQEAQKAYGAYANTYLTSGKMAQSVGMALKSTFQEFGAALEPIFAAVTAGLLSFVQAVRDIFTDEATLGSVKSWAERVAGYIIAVIRIIGTLLSKIPVVGSKFKNMANFSFKAATASQNLTDSLTGTGSAMDDTSASASKLKKNLAGLAAFDEMTVLKAGTETGGGLATGGGINPEDFMLDQGAIDESINKINEWADKYSAIFNNLGATIRGFFTTLFDGIDFSGPSLLFEQMWNDLSVSMAKWSPVINTNIQTFLNGLYTDLFTPSLELIKMVWNDTWKILNNTWSIHGTAISDNIGKFMANVTKEFSLLWTNVLAPIVKPFLEALRNAWRDSLAPALQTVSNFVAKVVLLALTIYNNFISPIVQWLMVQLKPVFESVGKVIGTVVNTVLDIIGKFINFMFTGANQILDFLIYVFSGGWKNVWQSIKDTFANIFYGIMDVAKSVINWVIDKINGFINGINKIKVDIPGIGKVGFNIPNIPRLAQGGIVESKTLAVLGENGREAVVPLDNSDWMSELVEKINGREGAIQLVVKIGDDTIYDKAVEYINDKAMRGGVNLVTI